MIKCREYNNTREGEAISPSSFYSTLFNLKVEKGQYHTEKVSCFCGADNYKVITQKDRYGIDYSLCLCQECGILYSNPRMTDESFKKFYEDDYRNIYSDRGEISDIQNATHGNDRIKKLIDRLVEDFELTEIKTVYEIGCGNGSNLYQFKGCKCVGVDYDRSIVRNNGIDLRFGGIEVLEGLNEKADLIIMNHVLEHMTDIERDLKRIHALLNDKGLLYISVPPLYGSDPKQLIQNAHNYQFTGSSLEYVMTVCGFSDYYLTEEIESVWHKHPPIEKSQKTNAECLSIETYLTGDKFVLPQIRMGCKFSTKERRDNIKHTIKLGIPEITELINKHPDGEAVIIAGSPSINGYVDKIKELQNKGYLVISIDRMYKWCLSHDIKPDYVIALDASEDVIESFEKINPDTTHLIVGQVVPKVIDFLKDYKTYYFLLMSKGISYSEIYPKEAYQRITFINSGSSVALCSLNIALTMGIKRLHIFGFDCHLGGGNYAEGISGKGDVKQEMEIEIDGRTFKTTASLYSFMRQFFDMYKTGKDLNMLEDVKIYGDSMIKHAAQPEVKIDGDKE